MTLANTPTARMLETLAARQGEELQSVYAALLAYYHRDRDPGAAADAIAGAQCALSVAYDECDRMAAAIYAAEEREHEQMERTR